MSAERKATCRCGWDGEGEHPCHYRGYACKKPAKQRFYGPRLVSLAGMQPKCEVSETWACDECWEDFQALLGEYRPNLPDNHLNPNKADDASR